MTEAVTRADLIALSYSKMAGGFMMSGDVEMIILTRFSQFKLQIS